MRRKTRNTRSSTKGKTETGSPSPRKSTRSSTRREEGEESSAKNEVEIEPDKVEIETETVCGNKITDSEQVENNSDLIVEETQEVQKSEIVEDIEVKEKDEENDKGKSTGINKTNTDQTSNTIEPEIVNENVQGSTPPPIDTDDIVQNSNDTEIIKSKVEDQNEELNEKSKDTEPKTSEIQDSSKSQTDNFQSEYANENLQEQTNFEQNNHDDKVATLDSKTNNNEEKLDSNTNHKEEQLDSNTEEQPEKKKITLKRPPLEETKRSSSPLEDGEIQEPKEKTKKIILKRRTVSDDNSDFNNKIVINRRSSAGEENPEKRKRQISVTEETTSEKPKKPSKVVKLIRNISHDSQDTEDNHNKPLRRQNSWGKTEFLDNLSANIYTVDVDSIKSVCTTVEFLNESEVKLEDAPKEHPKIESDVIKKKVEEEKTDDDTEKEETEEEESSEEQKIEANPNIIALNRKISIVEDTAAKMRPPPSPAKNPPSEILYITNLVRPFTVKQLKELLERTGKIREDCFWTDRIKSKCYARYETIEEAEATRNALHGVFWPIGNGKQLVIDFATEEDMEKAKNPVPTPTIVPEQPIQKENQEPDLSDVRHRERDRDPEREERRRTTSGRDWDKNREDHRRKHSRSRSRSRDRVRKHSRRSYTPEDHNRKKQKFGDESVPQKLMDDLFLKTKTTPSIYWQPLSPHEIATKQQQRLVRMEKHKRKIEETRGRRDRDVRGSFRRR